MRRCVYRYIYAYLCIYVYLHIFMDMYIFMYIYIHMYIYTYMYIYAYIYIYTYTYIHLYIHIDWYMHIYLHIYGYTSWYPPCKSDRMSVPMSQLLITPFLRVCLCVSDASKHDMWVQGNSLIGLPYMPYSNPYLQYPTLFSPYFQYTTPHSIYNFAGNPRIPAPLSGVRGRQHKPGIISSKSFFLVVFLRQARVSRPSFFCGWKKMERIKLVWQDQTCMAQMFVTLIH